MPHDLASIKQIDAIEIGVEASKLGGSVQRVQGKAIGRGVSDDDSGRLGNADQQGLVDPGTMNPGVLGDDQGVAMGDAVKDPGDGRYLDLQYKPLLAKDLRASYQEKDPNKARLAVAKRMPIRMVLQMDQRKLIDLIANCGNSKLPIEIRQVRINAKATVKVGQSRGNIDRIGARLLGQQPVRLGGARGGIGRTATAAKGKFDVPIELFGVVYIYNPVAVPSPNAAASFPATRKRCLKGTIFPPPVRKIPLFQTCGPA